jgi:Asp-tRNA(Asn)/Glu-tRNA(Gln) amidotransferase A subunit family amidase
LRTASPIAVAVLDAEEATAAADVKGDEAVVVVRASVSRAAGSASSSSSLSGSTGNARAQDAAAGSCDGRWRLRCGP